MIKELVHDPIFLAGRSEEATKGDGAVAEDLLATFLAHRQTCVGMAANMIGVRKRIIVFLDESGASSRVCLMFNPQIIAKSGAYETEEGCLSLLGAPRKTRRFRTVKVRYQTPEMLTRVGTFTDFTAQIIQHEVDHLDGILI